MASIITSHTRAEHAATATRLPGIVRVWRLIPPERVPKARETLPCVELGEQLCKAFELFRIIVPGCAMTMDRLILLTMALAERQLTLGHCRECNAAILLDPTDIARELCQWCERDRSPRDSLAKLEESGAMPSDPPGGVQQSLF